MTKLNGLHGNIDPLLAQGQYEAKERQFDTDVVVYLTTIPLNQYSTQREEEPWSRMINTIMSWHQRLTAYKCYIVDQDTQPVKVSGHKTRTGMHVHTQVAYAHTVHW